MTLFMTRQAPSSRSRFCSPVCGNAATRERKLAERKQIGIEFSERNSPPTGCAWVTVLAEKGEFVFTLVDADQYDELSDTLWGLSTQGYVGVSLKGGARQALHHLVLDRPSSQVEIDHINRDRLDNRRSNLRVATHAQNCVNVYRDPGKASGYRGVTIFQGRWRARIAVEGDRLFLGCFDSELEAALAYDEAAKAYHGEFAQLNFPEDV